MAAALDRPGVYRISGQQRMTCPPTTSARQPSGRRRNWHVLATSYGQQFSAEREIDAARWEVYNPLHLQRSVRHPDKIVPLFPSYLFVAWPEGTDWGSLRRIRHVWKVLMSEPGRPAIVPPGLVEELQRRTSPRRIVDDPLHTPPRFRFGQQVKISAGVLAGLDGICKLSDA